VSDHGLALGGSTFLGAPFVRPAAVDIRAHGARAVFLGAPVDTGVVPARPGTPLGPAACRAASAQFAGYPLYDARVDVRGWWRLVDCGDAATGTADIGRSHGAIHDACAEALAAGAVPVLMGGDHSVPIPALAALCRHVEGRVGYLQFDAHLDTADEIDGERRTMASPVARALDHPNVDPANVVVVGVRGAANSFEEMEAAEALGVGIVPMQQCLEQGVLQAVEDALDRVSGGTEAVYVSFDNDAADTSCAPGTTAPEPGGFTTREVLQIAAAVGRRGVAMLDVVELSPPYDPAGITARLDCYWIINVLAAYAGAIEQGHAEPPVQAGWGDAR
jgi:agmatinase